jgi:hypothetical protein
MCLSREAVERPFRLRIAVAAVAVMVLTAMVPVWAAQPTTPGPIAVPRAAAPASAPVSAPAATRSAEEVLLDQIFGLRNLPRVPAGKRLDEVPEIREQLNEQLAKSLALTSEYLKKYPTSPNADEVLIQRVDTVRLQAVVNDKPLDAFRAEAAEVLAGDSSEKVKSYVAFMLVQADLQDLSKALMEDRQMSKEQKDEMWRQTRTRQARDYLKKYPKSEFAKEFYGFLIDAAVRNRDFDGANELLDQLKANFPDEPAIPDISDHIRQAAATQAATDQFGPPRAVTTTLPGAATQPGKSPKAAPATRKASAQE